MTSVALNVRVFGLSCWLVFWVVSCPARPDESTEVNGFRHHFQENPENILPEDSTRKPAPLGVSQQLSMVVFGSVVKSCDCKDLSNAPAFQNV